MKLIKESAGEKLEKYDFRDAIFVMLSDMVAQCCFSIKDPNNHLASIVRRILVGDGTEIATSPTAEIWSYSFPILARLIPSLINPKASKDFRVTFSQILEARIKSGEKRKDVVDICVEAMNKLESPEFKKVGITEETIAFQAFVFFFGGQDQISTLCASLIYNLVKNPKIEEKLYKEVDQFLKKYEGKIDHDNLTELVYLTACLNETLRLVPYFTRTERVCTKDWKNHEFRLDIKKGMVIVIPIWAANRNPHHFPHPETFDPQRFLSPNKDKLHPYAATAFGFGPRSCPGAKFSFEVLLILSAVMLKHFKFHLRLDSTPVYVAGGLFIGPHLPFYFDITKR